jgi:hypothetical protein
MKKILLALMAVVVLSGCGANKGKGGWTKDEMTSDQLQKDYWECQGPSYVKEEMIWEEYEKDFDTCSCKLSPIIPLFTLNPTYSYRCDLCMKERGYKKVKWESPFFPEVKPKKGLEITNCMKGKGYEWK